MRREGNEDEISPSTTQTCNKYFGGIMREDREDSQFVNSNNINTHVTTQETQIRLSIAEVCGAIKSGWAPGAGNISEELIICGTDKPFYMH